MKTVSQLDRKVQFAFGAAILALGLVGAISYRATVVFSESDRWVQHTHEVLEKLHELSYFMENVEASCRGFVLTGSDSYLETCRTSKQAAMQDEVAIANLTVDNPAQQAQIPGLQRLTAEKFALADKVIRLRRTQGLTVAADVIQKGEGQQIMAEFLTVVGQMQDEELRLLALRSATAQRRLAQTKALLLFGTLLGALIAGGAGWAVRQDAVARERAELAAHDSETRFAIMANNISQLAWMADGSGHIFWFNDRWFDYTGTTLAEVTGWGGKNCFIPTTVSG